jgi:hypothetical protein
VVLACDSNSETTRAQDARQAGADENAAPSPAASPAGEANLAEEEPEEESAARQPRLEAEEEQKPSSDFKRELDDAKTGERKNEAAGPLGADRWDQDSDGGSKRAKAKDKGAIASYESELRKLEEQMRMAGVALPPEAALAGATSKSAGGTVTATPSDRPLDCQKACELTEAICSLADSICDMKKRHPGDERYDNACARAELDCSLGKQTCESCSGD